MGVHIADVSYFVENGNTLDAIASQRATSVYMVQKVRSHGDSLSFLVISCYMVSNWKLQIVIANWYSHDLMVDSQFEVEKHSFYFDYQVCFLTCR